MGSPEELSIPVPSGGGVIKNSSPPIQRVLVAGGTHGNEWTGAYLVQKLERQLDRLQRSSLETLTLLANPLALEAGRRYVDTDLNRCFRPSDLQDVSRSSYENLRARELAAQFGDQGKTPVDAILDLHSTTANMGLTVITYEHPVSLRLIAYLQSLNPAVKGYLLPGTRENGSGLRSLCDLGFAIEVGPIAPATLHAQLFQQTETLIHQSLDFFEQYNGGKLPAVDPVLTVYRHLENLDYPRDAARDLQAMIHPHLQFRDYEPLHPGDPVFLTWEGETIVYSGTTTVYPVFINEAAYYEKGIALCLTQKQEIRL